MKSTFLSFLALVCALPVLAGELPSRPRQTDPQGFYFQPAGLADDYPEESATPEKIKKDLEIAREAGARFLRVGVGWDSIETAPGKYDWKLLDELVSLSEKYGVKLLPYVCYTPEWLVDDKKDFWRKPPRDLKRFGQFMKVIASRYKGRIHSWELWNEPDLQNYWLGTPAQFAEMVIEGAREVRQADPKATVVLGGIAEANKPFLRELLKKHSIARHFDVINLHGYLETWNPLVAEEYPRLLQEARELAGGKELWLAEFGYSNYRFKPSQVSEWGVDAIYDYEHTPRYQAVALFKHHVLAAASEDLSLTTWYRINDLPPKEAVIGDANNRFLGIVDAKGRKKPAFQALKLYNELFSQPVKLANERVIVKKGSHAEVHVFERKDGSWVVNAWLKSSRREDVKNRTGMARDLRREVVRLKLPTPGRQQLRTLRLDGRKSAWRAIAHGRLPEIRLKGGEVFIAEIAPSQGRALAPK